MNTPAENTYTRREFLKRSGAAAVALWWLANGPTPAFAEGGATDPDGVGVLIDISRCQGCNNCALACKQSNGLPSAAEPPQQLDAETFTFVGEYQVVNQAGESVTRHVKRQCMHCQDAACVSACPAAAMYKTETGAVSYRPERCLGCRYCQIGCPFGVPQFEWHDGLSPEIKKCWMCYERLGEGQMPACVDACPTGALRFGKRGALLAQAHATIDAKPKQYVNHVYGEHEVGGTSMLYISDVPFAQLGFPVGLPDTSPRHETEKSMSRLPGVIGVLAAGVTGITLFTHRRRLELESESIKVKED